jgi:hypothetical protein|nr:MAG TPA: hypothetical protein [Caudoviricetes sp.]
MKTNLMMLKDGGLDRLINLVQDRSKSSILKISSDLDIYILWTITYLDKWSVPNNALNAILTTPEFDINKIKEDLDSHKSYRDQLATLETCIERVFRLKNFDMIEKDKLSDADKVYVELSTEILEKLDTMLS